MIGIKVNGEYLDLDPDTQIGFKLNNPIFAEDGKISGSFSLPFALPGGDRSERNARIMRHPDVVENNVALFSYDDTVIEFDGLDFQSGRFEVQKVDRAMQANFIFGLNAIAEDFATKPIRDLVAESIDLYDPAHSYSKSVVVQFGASAADPFVLVVNGNSYSASTVAGLVTAITDTGISVVFQDTGSTYGVSGDRLLISNNTSGIDRQLTVDFEQSARPSDWLIVSRPFDDIYDDIDAFFADFTSATPSKDYIKLPWMRIPETRLRTSTCNVYKAGHYAVENAGYNAFISPPIMPLVTLKHVFDKLASTFGVTVKGTFIDDPYFSKALIVHNYPIWEDQVYVGSTNYRFFHQSFDLSSLVPDMTLAGFLKALQSKYNLAIYASGNGRSLVVNYRKPILSTSSYTEWTDLVSPPQEVAFMAATGVRLETKKDAEDTIDQDDAYETGTPSVTITSQLGSVKADWGNVSPPIEYGPRIWAPWSDKFSFRLVFYEGLQDSIDASFQYAKASFKGMEVTYSGTGALAETQWAGWLHFLQHRKEVSFLANLEYRHLNQLDWERKYRIAGVDYLIKDIDMTLTTRGILPSKVTMYTI